MSLRSRCAGASSRWSAMGTRCDRVLSLVALVCFPTCVVVACSTPNWDNKVQTGQMAAVAAILISSCHIIHQCCRSKKQGLLFQTEMIILAIVPFYAMTAMYSLTKVRDNFLISVIAALFRELYEAFGLFAFVQFVLIWLGGFDPVVKAFMRDDQKPQHVWVSCFPTLMERCPRLTQIPMPFQRGGRLIRGILRGMLQYFVVSLIVSAILVSRWLFLVVGLVVETGMTRDEASDMYKAWESPLSMAKGISLGYAMYCTFLMLKETERNEELKDKFEEINPEAKFWGIKLLIGLTMFQKFVFAKFLPRFLPSQTSMGGEVFSPEDFGVAMQNLVMCFELLLFALSHIWVYPLDEGGQQDAKPRWYDSPFISMCRFVDNERDFQLVLEEFRKNLEYANNEKMMTMKSDLEEKFMVFHPNREKRFSPFEFQFQLKQAGYSKNEIDKLKYCARQNAYWRSRVVQGVGQDAEIKRAWDKFCEANPTTSNRVNYDPNEYSVDALQRFAREHGFAGNQPETNESPGLDAPLLPKELGPKYIDYHDLCNHLDTPVPAWRQGTIDLG